MVQKINSFFYKFFLPIITGLILSAIVGLFSIVLDVVELKQKTNSIQSDVDEIRAITLPEIKKELEDLHVFLIHSADSVKSKVNLKDNLEDNVKQNLGLKRGSKRGELSGVFQELNL